MDRRSFLKAALGAAVAAPAVVKAGMESANVSYSSISQLMFTDFDNYSSRIFVGGDAQQFDGWTSVSEIERLEGLDEKQGLIRGRLQIDHFTCDKTNENCRARFSNSHNMSSTALLTTMTDFARGEADGQAD